MTRLIASPSLTASATRFARSHRKRGESEVHRRPLEVAIDGTPRTYRDRKELAIGGGDAAQDEEVHVEVMVRDIETGEVIPVKHPLQK
jgi:hypothetical protein